MKTFILLTVMIFITACSIHQEPPVEATEEVKAPVVKTASACSDERSCK